MKRFIQLVFLVAVSMYNAIQTVTGGATLKKLAPSGVINQGILGGFSGKVGPVVGGKWKDVDYMRSYVIPSNPNTTGQQAVRLKFSNLVAVARSALSALLQPFWDPFYSGMSGFNAFISQNYSLSSSTGIIDATAIITKGTLYQAPGMDSTLNAITHVATITWDGTLSGNAELTDSVGVAIYVPGTNEILTYTPAATREDETVDYTVPSNLVGSDFTSFLFFYRGTGSELIVSDNSGQETPAA